MAVAELTVDIKTNSSKATKGFTGLSKSLKKVSSGAKSATKHSQGLFSKLSKIASLKILRGIISGIGKAMSEGLKNAVSFSRGIGGTMAKALDGISSNALVMKNQLGSALGELLTTLSPVINTIVNLITKAENALSQFFALLGGRTTYLKAGSDAVSKWGDSASSAGKSAKEWKNQLMGFDEINRLDDQSDSSGGGSGSSSDFGSGSESTLSTFFSDLKGLIDGGDFSGAGKMLADKLNEMIAKLDLKEFGRKLGEKIQSGISFALGFITNFDFSTTGTKVMSFFTGLFDSVSGEDVGNLISSTITGALEFLSGATEEFGDGGLGEKVGTWLGNLFNGAVNGLDVSTLGDSLSNLCQGIADLAGSFFSTVDWSAFSENFLGGISDAIFGAIGSVFGNILNAVQEWYNEIYFSCQDDGKNIILGLLEGIWDAIKGIGTWIYDHIFKPFVDAFDNVFGIHSPSKVMAEQGGFLIQGLLDGITKKWNTLIENVKGFWEKLKNWWKNLSLPEIKLKMPHITLGTRPASGWIADALNFFGIPANLPTISVDWYAKGGIVNGASLIGAGEAGREAIVPLENNTEWIDKVAEKVALSITSNGGSDNNVYVYLDGRQLSDSVTKWQRMSNRASGVNV